MATADPPLAELPDGVEIVTRAEHPELVPAMYEVALEAVPDIPGNDGKGPGGFEDWHAFEIERPKPGSTDGRNTALFDQQ